MALVLSPFVPSSSRLHRKVAYDLSMALIKCNLARTVLKVTFGDRRVLSLRRLHMFAMLLGDRSRLSHDTSRVCTLDQTRRIRVSNFVALVFTCSRVFAMDTRSDFSIDRFPSHAVSNRCATTTSCVSEGNANKRVGTLDVQPSLGVL